MDELIKKIIDIEEKAKKIDSENEKVISQIKSEAEGETEEIKRQIKNKVVGKCSSIKSIEDEYAEKRKEEIFNLTNEKKEKLLKRYSEKKEQWVSDIVSDILS